MLLSLLTTSILFRSRAYFLLGNVLHACERPSCGCKIDWQSLLAVWPLTERLTWGSWMVAGKHFSFCGVFPLRLSPWFFPRSTVSALSTFLSSAKLPWKHLWHSSLWFTIHSSWFIMANAIGLFRLQHTLSIFSCSCYRSTIRRALENGATVAFVRDMHPLFPN